MRQACSGCCCIPISSHGTWPDRALLTLAVVGPAVVVDETVVQEELAGTDGAAVGAEFVYMSARE